MLRSLHACRSSIGFRAAGLLLLLGGLLCALPTLRGVSAQATARPAENGPQADASSQPDVPDENAETVDEPKTYDGKDFAWWRANLRTELKPELRAEALRAMGHFGANGYEDEATAIIIDVVASYDTSERDPDTNNIRDAAADALRRIGPSTTSALIAALSSENSNRRRFAVPILARSTPNEAIIQALIAATRDSDPEIRRSAVGGVGRTESDLVIPALTAALTDEDDEVRSYAASALGRFQSRAGEAVPALIAAAQDEHEFVRLIALNALARIQPAPKLVVPTFTEALNDEERSVRQEGIRYLGLVGPEARSAVPALIDAYSRVSASDQRLIIETLGNIGPDSREAIPLITRALQEDNESTQRAAAAALEKITE